jgi:hypothetical protein
MDSLFGRKPAVSLDPTDRVIPLHFFENSPLVQGNNMAVSLAFDEVLDPEKLRASLEGLVKREGWQRLGGRLRKGLWEDRMARACSIHCYPSGNQLLAR